MTTNCDEIRAVFERNYFRSWNGARVFAPVLGRNVGGALVGLVPVLSRSQTQLPMAHPKVALLVGEELLARGVGTDVIGAHIGYTDSEMVTKFGATEKRPRPSLSLTRAGGRWRNRGVGRLRRHANGQGFPVWDARTCRSRDAPRDAVASRRTDSSLRLRGEFQTRPTKWRAQALHGTRNLRSHLPCAVF